MRSGFHLTFDQALNVTATEFSFSAEHISRLDKELGYPCYVLDNADAWRSFPGENLSSFAYMGFISAVGESSNYSSSFHSSLILFLPVFVVWAAMALVYGCKAYGGRLLRVIGRDGAVYYLAAAGRRPIHPRP
jgi:hypothetical protein